MKDIGNGYFATEDGRIWSRKTNKYVKERIGPRGYYMVNLSIDGKCKTFTLHRLIANAFLPNTENLSQINHKDGNKLNNNVSNLEWCSARYNTRHALDNNLAHRARGNKTKHGKFNEQDIRDIRTMINQNHLKCSQVAKLYNVTKSAIQQIIWKKTYYYIS